MILIPYRRTKIVSTLSPEEFVQRLGRFTSPRQPWFIPLPKEFLFAGSVSSNQFWLVPLIRGRNTYRPLICGIIHAAPGGSQIQLVQTLHPVSIVFVVGFFLFIVFQQGFPVIAASLIFLIFHCTMYFVGFLPDAKIAEERMRILAS